MSVLDLIKKKAIENFGSVVLPEGSDERTIRAAKMIVAQKIARVTLLGNNKELEKRARLFGLDISAVTVIDPSESSELDDYTSEFMELRKGKGLSRDQAREKMSSPLYYGAMMVRRDLADASVAGATSTTRDVLRAAIGVIGLKDGTRTVSSCFLMTLPIYHDVQNKVFLYADAAVVPNPNAEQLASIAASTAQTMVKLLGKEPRVAMLSFSTKGSARHADVDKVTKALEILKKNHPDLKVDGELQVDAAIVPEVARKKAPGSAIAGDANILIFPDLDAGNIAYKITERLANATATGPIIQGLAKPANDLSRGCSADDIVDVTAIATLMKG